jgi:hypothetical protein
MQVLVHSGSTNFSTSDSIDYLLRATSNGISVFYPNDEYLCFAEMFDASGNAVLPRSSFGTLGLHFFDLKYPSGEQPWEQIEHILRIRPAHGTQSAKADRDLLGRKGWAGRPFHTSDEMFDLKAPGRYRLKLRFQVYEWVYKGGQTYAYILERFDPVEFFVTKKQ